MKIIVVSAHPDDLEIACSGTLLSLQQQGHEIISVITVKPSREDRASRDQITVSRELALSCKISGFETRVMDTDLHDDGRPNLMVDNNTVRKLSDMIDSCDLAIIPNLEDYHQDHRNTYHIAWPIVSRRANKVWLMHSWPYCHYYRQTSPNLYRDITDQWQTKERLLNCYDSYFDHQQIQEIKNLNTVWGQINRSNLAEAFTMVIDRG